MVTCNSVRRAVGGKTIKVDLEVTNGVIKNIIISGDFFLFPEDYIHLIESRLRGLKIHEVPNVMLEFKDSVEVVGASIEEFIDVINEAYKSCMGE
ncbi:MAG: lipoate protein ligase C-terminal domain-containing protein [Sulfolobales archaeon]|nr:hypothetical protein [Sulfolobales archaeon]MCX8186628.1 hypothetical protein [Sulfolobales archaeon]MDW7969923.1 lipoate protein ligase C-terminal domain-containing protein [Sulfolobales archaeon]